MKYLLLVLLLSFTSCSYLKGEDGADGADGTDGKNGYNGSDGHNGTSGKSFNWLGEMNEYPDDPSENDVFYNSADGNSYIFTGSIWEVFASGNLYIPVIDSIVDPRDGNVYRTTKIGTQEWLSENLRFSTDDSRCLLNDSVLCAKCGKAYSWKEAVNASEFDDSDPSSIQGICPDGWHIPSYGEWVKLEGFTGGNNSKYTRATYSWGNDPGYDRYGLSIVACGSDYLTPGPDTAVYEYKRELFTDMVSYWTTSSPKYAYEGVSSDSLSLRIIIASTYYTYTSFKAAHEYVRCIKN